MAVRGEVEPTLSVGGISTDNEDEIHNVLNAELSLGMVIAP